MCVGTGVIERFGESFFVLVDGIASLRTNELHLQSFQSWRVLHSTYMYLETLELCAQPWE